MTKILIKREYAGRSKSYIISFDINFLGKQGGSVFQVFCHHPGKPWNKQGTFGPKSVQDANGWIMWMKPQHGFSIMHDRPYTCLLGNDFKGCMDKLSHFRQ